MNHKKWFVFSLVLLLLILLFTGCSSQGVNDKKKNEIPEPYTLALNDIKNQNYDSAYKYLELAIKDFPESNYLNNAYFLKSIIDCAKTYNNAAIYDNINAGLDKGKIFFVHAKNSDDLNQIKSYTNFLDKENENLKNKLVEDAKFSLSNLDKNYLKFDSNVPDQNKITVNTRHTEYFKKYGTPIPTENEFNDEIKQYNRKMLSDFLQTIITPNTIDLPLYYNKLLNASFYQGLDKNILKQLADKVMQLTENDKYNKARLSTEEIIKEQKLNE